MNKLEKYVYKQLNIWRVDTYLIYPEYYKGFCIWYEDFLNKGQIKSGSGYFVKIDEAISKVDTNPCFKKWI